MENKTDWANVKANIAKLLGPCKELIKEVKERVGSFEKREISRKNQKKQSKTAGPTVLCINLMLHYRVDHLMLVV